jgi:hypothetical protein
MDEDEYQRIVDYENEIYDLEYGEDQESNEENDVVSEKSFQNADGSTDDNRPETKALNPVAPDAGLEPDVIDSDDLSEDERDLIYSRLYYASSRPVLTANASSDLKESSSLEEQPAASNGTKEGLSAQFAFELDLDNLPPSPEQQPSKQEDVASLDDDDDDDDDDDEVLFSSIESNYIVTISRPLLWAGST